MNIKLFIIGTLILLSFLNCKNKQNEAWINHTLLTIKQGKKISGNIVNMQKIVENTKKDKQSTESFNTIKKNLLFDIDQTKKLVMDNPEQVYNLNDIHKELLSINITKPDDLLSRKTVLLKSIQLMKEKISIYINIEEKLLEIRKKNK